jgi:hypothetical protein
MIAILLLDLQTNKFIAQDFKPGEAHLKKLRRAEGGANIFGVFRAKILGEGRSTSKSVEIFWAEIYWGRLFLCNKSHFVSLFYLY